MDDALPSPESTAAASQPPAPPNAANEQVELASVECPSSPRLLAAVEWFVAAADMERVDQAGGPFGLLIKVLPILEDEGGSERAAWLPLNRVIGESWRWTAPEPRPGREDLAAYLLSPERADRTDRDAALAWWVPQMGIGVMHEGKNRVRYLRQVCRAEAIPASVTSLHLPSSDRLQLLEAEIGAGRFYGLLLDGRWLTVLAHPDLSLPLLRAYGTYPQPWPRRLPALEVLLGSRAWQSRSDWTRSAIDIEAWQRRQDKRNAIVPGNPMDIVGIDTHWPGIRRLAWGALVGGVVAGLYVAADGPTGVLGVAAVAAVAQGFGAVIALTSPVVRGPRKFWRHGQDLNNDEGHA